MPRVFLSYRRSDSAASAGRLFDRLRDRFGEANVFRDLDTISPGAEFTEVIGEHIAQCDALIAVIGKDWLTATNEHGSRRLDDPNDVVRTEIRTALFLNKRVIPALVEGAAIPKAQELPSDLAALSSRNAIEISESRFDYDAGRLLAALDTGNAEGSRPVGASKPSKSLWAWISDEKHQRTLTFFGGGIAALALAIWTVFQYFHKPPSPPEKPSVTVNGGGVYAPHPKDTVISTGANATIIQGITLEQYEAGVKRREEELRREYRATSQDHKARIALLEKQLAAAEAKSQNPEKSLEAFQSTLAAADAALNTLRGVLPEEQVAQARQALQRGDTATAEKLFTQVVEKGKAQVQQGAAAAYQLGELAYQRIDYAKAYAHYLEAVQLDPDNPVYLNKAGNIAYEMGRYSEAQPAFEKALAIRERAPGPEHSEVAESLRGLAKLYHKQGHYAQAEPLFQRALAIEEKALGSAHPNTVNFRTKYAELLRKMKRSKEAARLEARDKTAPTKGGSGQ